MKRTEAQLCLHDARRLAHEVGNVLTPAKAYLERALDQDRLDDRTKHLLSHVQSSLSRLVELIEGVLGRVEAGGACRVEEVVREVVGLMSVVDPSKCIAVRRVHEWAGATVAVPSIQVHQLLTNLILNALAAADSGSRIEVTLSSENGGALVSIRNDGQVMPEILVHAIKDGRLPPEGLAFRSNGSGIGLRTSLEIAAKYGICMDAQVDRRGATTVSLRFPVLVEQVHRAA